MPKMPITATTSQKLRLFVSEPMGDKDVKELAGIGEVLGQRLANKGYDQANLVLSEFLKMRQSRKKFTSWLKRICNANIKQQRDCYNCLKDWCDYFL